MSELVTSEIHDGIAVISIDNPPVNALGPGVPEGILAQVEIAGKNEEVGAIVLIGRGRTFIAGADIKQLTLMASGQVDRGEGLRPLLQTIENCPKPVVCAIHGTALGGGLEIAMCCHYRIAVVNAKVGQPEVKIGIIPGAEGTQRLPRLVGIAPAAEMCATGRMVSAKEAEGLGIIDQIVGENLPSEAIAYARSKAELTTPHPKTSAQTEKLTLDETTNAHLEKLKQTLAKKARGLQAPLAAVDAVCAAANGNFNEGCQREAELFDRCLQSTEAAGLMHLFFGERATGKIPGLPSDLAPNQIKLAAVVGAGTMGGGITMSYLNAGIPVLLKELDQEALDRGLETIKRNYAMSVRRGKFSEADVEQRLSLITPTLDYNDLKDADIIVEAVFENLELKKRVFTELDTVAKPSAILASNTSTLDIDQIAAATQRPESVIGHHFFSPANVMKLLEIVRSSQTKPEVIGSSMALAKKLRKVGVLVGNCFGFVGNRMFNPYTNEAQFLIEEGATVLEVDQALFEFGWAMGPLAVLDLAGNDVGWRIHQEIKDTIPKGKRQPLMTDLMYEHKRWGQKTGKGWYRYDEGQRRGTPDPEFEAEIRETATENGIAQRKISSDEIIERTIYALINEGARILEEGIALRASDIDIIYIYGYGFPAFRGGPMHYADTIGLKKVYQRVAEFEQTQGSWWKPAPLLERLAAEGKSFAEQDQNKK